MRQDYVKGTEALQANPRESYALPHELPSLDVIEGTGQASRQLIDLQALKRVFVALLIGIVALTAISALRISLFAETTRALQQNSSLRSQIRDAQTLNKDLTVQTSLLSSSDRIIRIATNNMGMVRAHASNTVVLELPETSDEPLSAASSETSDEPLSVASSETSDEPLSAASSENTQTDDVMSQSTQD